MKAAISNRSVLEWLSIPTAVATGPVFVGLTSLTHLTFGLAGIAYFIVCASLVPILTYGAGRFRFVAWQLAIVSLTLSVIASNLRIGIQMHTRELLSVGYGFWFFGTLLSSPLLIYFRLKFLPPRRRYIEASTIAATALVLYSVSAFIIR